MTDGERRQAFADAFIAQARSDDYRGKEAKLQGLLARARNIAREIEKLAPSIDRKDSPENAEYPWERDGQVIAPCMYGFPSLSLLRDPGGRSFLNLIERALQDFERLTLP